MGAGREAGDGMNNVNMQLDAKGRDAVDAEMDVASMYIYTRW